MTGDLIFATRQSTADTSQLPSEEGELSEVHSGDYKMSGFIELRESSFAN